MSIKQQFYFLAILSIGFALAAKIYVLLVAYPHWDDSYYLNIAINYMDNGLLTPRMWRLDADTNIIAGSGTGYGIYLPNIWYQTVGLSLLSGRIMMYLVALLILPVIYLTARLWWGGQLAGIIAVVFTVLNPMFLYSYNLRMDAFGILTYSLVLLLHIYAIRSKRHYLHFFVGIAAVLAAEVHILAVLYLFGFAFYYAVDQIKHIVTLRRIQLKPETMFYMSGALLAGLIYIAVHILPNPEEYFAIVRTCPNCGVPFVEKEMLRFLTFFMYAISPTVIFIIAIYGLARRKIQHSGHYLLLLAGVFLMTIIIGPPPQFEYVSHYLPLISLGIAGFFCSYYSKLEMLSQKSIYIALLILTFMLIPLTWRTVHTKPADTYEEIDYIQAHIPNDAVIVGPPFLYTYLIDYHNFMTIADGDVYGIRFRGESFDTFLEREAPEVIITDQYIYAQECPESLDALRNYIEVHDMVFVLPNLVVARELVPDASAIETVTKQYPECEQQD